ncbi:hypothetical protein OCH7691_04212 [Oceanibacterium hippocampi]|uniref:Uncharacterized protein n=2 Tax=Oceanibacterium hippocampi TaxID=745714 RepID=A0A1Y5TYB2_9PROT|nr:hypothetical protein OCH7691_04212 [Oceanibacterium hippocampi]
MLRFLVPQIRRRFLAIPVAALVAITIAAAGSAVAGPADVVAVTVEKTGPEVYRFRVTVRHDDSGWDHYANRWEVLDMQGNLLGQRVLMHPHVDEQPFTRSGMISVPMDVKRVRVRAHDLKDGYGGAEVTVELDAP